MSRPKKNQRKPRGTVGVRWNRLQEKHDRILAIQEALKKRGEYATTIDQAYEQVIERGAPIIEAELNLIPATV